MPTDKRIYPLTGRIVGLCGLTFYGLWKRGKRNYLCRSMKHRLRDMDARPCDDRQFPAQPTEEEVWARVVDMLGSEEALQALAERMVDGSGSRSRTAVTPWRSWSGTSSTWKDRSTA